MDCIFCKIINKEIPSFILREDDDFLVILDRFPASVGHTLIISKTHSEDIFSIDRGILKKAMPLALDVANKLRVLNFDGLNIVQNNRKAAGQTVFHFHMHLIPRWEGDSVPINFAGREVSVEELEELRDRIINA